MDSIIAGIESVFPETGIHSDAETDLWENIQYISSKMALFIAGVPRSGKSTISQKIAKNWGYQHGLNNCGN